jgi:hypothetical protein
MRLRIGAGSHSGFSLVPSSFACHAEALAEAGHSDFVILVIPITRIIRGRF